MQCKSLTILVVIICHTSSGVEMINVTHYHMASVLTETLNETIIMSPAVKRRKMCRYITLCTVTMSLKHSCI